MVQAVAVAWDVGHTYRLEFVATSVLDIDRDDRKANWSNALRYQCDIRLVKTQMQANNERIVHQIAEA